MSGATLRRQQYTQDILDAAASDVTPPWLPVGGGVYMVVAGSHFTALAGCAQQCSLPEGQPIFQVCFSPRPWFEGYSPDPCQGRTMHCTHYGRSVPFPTSDVGLYEAEENPVTLQHITKRMFGEFLTKIICRFPKPLWPPPPVSADLWQPSLACDVFALREHEASRLASVRHLLDGLAAEVGDTPVPKYRHIIDPNLCLSRGRWVASEWDISPEGVATIVGRGGGQEVAHTHSRVVDEVFTPVLQAALPVLAALQRPALHLAGRRLQAVPKAQRIVVPPRGVRVEGESDDTPGGEYEGLWHVDGDVEDIAAVVLYYYDVDAALEGGAMEFAAKDYWGVTGPWDFSKDVVREQVGEALPIFKVPVETGTLLVFSNYQMVHRVLRMVNTSSSEASRGFAALFIVDPGSELPSACTHLVSEAWLSQTPAERHVGRLTKLQAQLLPTGRFSGDVYQTGNSCSMLLSWLGQNIEQALCEEGFDHSEFATAARTYDSMMRAPRQVNRGVSELLSATTVQCSAPGGGGSGGDTASDVS